jgi:L-lactate dehydrogenase
MKRRVAIIGTGWVGSSVAISTLHAGVADELILHDVREAVAEGEAMDLAHGAAFYAPAVVRTASVEEMVDADVVVIAAGRGGKAGESRLDLLRENASVVADIGTRLRRARGTIVVVTNPVDVLTKRMAQVSGLPAARVVGTGTMLDTARLRQIVGRAIGVNSRSVHAHVVGEHGDSEVVLWTAARAGGIPLRAWIGWDPARETAIADEVRRAAYEIIRRKGATNHAIGLVTADLLRCILRDERRVLTVSRVQEGAAGLTDVALSLPTIVGMQGAAEVLEPEMSAEERRRLHHSADLLRGAAVVDHDGETANVAMSTSGEAEVRQTVGEVVIDGASRRIEIDRPQGRFELRIGDHAGFITFRVNGSALSLIHTEVPAALRGRGIAETLARAAMDYARQHAMTIQPFCPFVATFIKRHSEFQALVDPTFTISRREDG